MNRDNLHDRFNYNWANACSYPRTVLRSPRPHEAHTRSVHFDRLRDDQETLFDAEEQELEIWETRRKNSSSITTLASSTFRTVDGMRKHLESAHKDPNIRHTFLESADSRAPLNCSPEMLTTLLTYHQVEPSFLDAVHTFGDQDDPKDLCLMSLRASDTLTTPKAELIKIPELGRSGRELHVSYLLRSVEYKSRDWPWQIRQAAIYHSFDTETGASFWLTIKGNNELNHRIKEMSPYLNLPAKPADWNASLSFKASLATHLVYLSWCDDNWRGFINDVECGVRRILEHARKAPIDDNLNKDPAELVTYPKSQRETKSRTGTMGSSGTQSRTTSGLAESPGLNRKSTWETIISAHKALAHFMDGSTRKKVTDEEKGLAQAQASAPVQTEGSTESLVDTREVLNEFRFGEVQTLYTFSDRIHRALLTLKLNISVLNELHAYYERLRTSDIEAFHNIKAACGDSLADFLREVRSILQRLETRRSQLECLAVLLTEGNTLYDGILQYRQLDISQRFQETAQDSAEQMRIIANKTRLETASMHVITVVTLVFLPATFLSSGVFLWNNNTPQGMMETYRYRGDSFRLFISVSVPMMVIILGIWLFVFLSMKKKMDTERKAQVNTELIRGKADI